MSNWHAIPEELQSSKQWIVWRTIPFPPHPSHPEDIPDRTSKVLYDARTGQKASSSEPTTWSTFEDAINAYNGGGYDGIGFVFTQNDPYCGADIDFNKGSQGLPPDYKEVIEELDSYTEISPSGKGFHVILRGSLPNQGPVIGGGYEFYDKNRWFAMTGDHVGGIPMSINERDEQFKRICNRQSELNNGRFNLQPKTNISPDENNT